MSKGYFPVRSSEQIISTGLPSECVTQLIPDIRIVGGDLGQADTRGFNPVFYRVDRNFDSRVVVHTVRLQPRRFDRWRKNIDEPLVEFTIVKWLNYKTCSHSELLTVCSKDVFRFIQLHRFSFCAIRHTMSERLDSTGFLRGIKGLLL